MSLTTTERDVVRAAAQRSRDADLRARVRALTDNELWELWRTFYGKHAHRDFRAALIEALGGARGTDASPPENTK